MAAKKKAKAAPKVEPQAPDATEPAPDAPPADEKKASKGKDLKATRPISYRDKDGLYCILEEGDSLPSSFTKQVVDRLKRLGAAE